LLVLYDIVFQNLVEMLVFMIE